MRRNANLIPALLLTLFLTACSGIVRSEQPRQSAWLEFPPSGSLGQTFTAKYNGLHGVRLSLRPVPQAAGQLILRLYPAPGEPGALREAVMAWSPQTAQDGQAFFKFEPLPDSGLADYYFEVTFEGEGRLEIACADGEAYLNGAAYRDSSPLDQQLSFGLEFQPGWLALGLAGDALRWLGYLLAATFLFLLPGWALMDWLWPGWRELDRICRFALAVPVGLALYPLLFLWARLVGLKPGALFAWIPALLLGGFLAWRLAGRTARTRSQPETAAPARSVGGENPVRREALLTWLVFLLVVGTAALARFWAIRGLDVPMWGDAVQHAAITRLMLINGGLFASWEPIAPYETLSIHFGFSAAAALYAWLLRMPADTAVLVAGQVLNLAAVVALYPLAFTLSRGSRWAGLAAIAAVGLAMRIPGIYVNWGRYAQLSGQAILPALMWMTISLLERRASMRRQATRKVTGYLGAPVLVGMVLAGMGLYYYRMPLAYLAFTLAWGALWALRRENRSLRVYGEGIFSLAIAAGVGLLLVLPWIPNLTGGVLGQEVAEGMGRAEPLAESLQDLQPWRDLAAVVPVLFTLLALAGVIWELLRRKFEPFGLVLWMLLMVVYSFGGLIQLPLAHFFQNFAIMIMAYIPVGVLCGYFFGEFVNFLAKAGLRLAAPAAASLLVLLVAWGVKGQARIVDPVTHSLVTRPDLRAMEWIDRHIAVDARFLVESFTIYNGLSSVGADGGWWIPQLAGRANTMPPQYALFNERPTDPGYSAEVTALVSLLEDQPAASPPGIAALCAQEVTHVYIGQRQGKVGVEVEQLFKPQEFLESPAFQLVYHQDRVYIFTLKPAACPEQE